MIMLCDRCHAKEASVHYTEIINGHRKEEHLCADCAGSENGVRMPAGFGHMGRLFGSFFDDPLFDTMWSTPFAALRSAKCPTCGTTLEELKEEGTLGCPDCYKNFRESLRPFFREMQEGTLHKGKTPETAEAAPVAGAEKENDEVKALKEKLTKLVAEENYEEAAKVRDEIRAKEGGK